MPTNSSAGMGGRIVALASFLPLLLLAVSALSVTAQQPQRGPAEKPKASRLSELADNALNEGDRLRAEWTSESLRRAIRKYTEAQFYWHIANAPSREVEILQRLGDVHTTLSQYQGAIDYYNKAEQLARILPDQRLEADVLDRLANAYLEIANSKRALSYCLQAQELSRQIGYLPGTIQALNCLGVASSLSSDVAQAQQNYEQALRLLSADQHGAQAALTLLNLGYLHSNLGNMQLALDFYDRALTIWRAINDRQKQALTLTAKGGVYALQGEKQEALDLHNEALKLFRTIGNRNGEAATLNGIGYVYDDLGDKGQALKCYTLALQIYQSIDNRNYAAITSGYLARVYFALGEKDKALNFYNQKLATSRSVQDRRMEAYTLKDIGNILSLTSDKDQAFDYYRQAQTLSQAVMDRRGEAYILNSIGSLFEQRGRQPEAVTYYRQALPLMQAVADRRGEVLTLYGLARAERDSGQLVAARTDIEASLDLIEKLRTKVVSPSLRISYLETVYQHYEFYVDMLMRMHRQDPAGGFETLALETNERARARTLLENLTEARTDIRHGVDSALLAEESRLRQQLNRKAEQQMRLLSGKCTPEQAAAIKQEVEILLAQYKDVESRVRDSSPRYAALTQPRQLILADIQRELDQDTLLVEYSLGVDRSYGWGVTATSITSFELPARAKIETVAKELYAILAVGIARKKNESRAEQKLRLAKSEAAYPLAAAKLSDMLVTPLVPLLGQKRLVIVADGLLQYIPFTALPEPGLTKSDLELAPPLVLNHEVITLPSLSTLAVLRAEVRGRTPAKKALAVLADPVFERDDPRVQRLRRNRAAPLSVSISRRDHQNRQRRQLEQAARELGGDDEPVTFQRLPFTLLEAQAISAIVPAAETKQAISFDASLKTALDPELRQYRIIHFATHGLLNNSYPELSGIVLSLIDGSGRPQDGFLRLNEIYSLDLPAELVVLSACQTALGKEARGEGLIGLTRGFMYAGVARVVASLWRINDRAAAELMRYFYEAMFQSHLAPAAALRAAQIRMWQTPKWRFPYYWAAFVVQGEWN